MDFGVIILSLKKPAYSLAAFNLALSIKHYNPNINITLVSDGEHRKHFHPEHYLQFNWIKEIDKDHYTGQDGTFQPALGKLNVYRYSGYKRTLYIDADSLVLQDLMPMFEKLKGSRFKSNVIEQYTQWTTKEMFNSFFGVDFGATVNSSWFYFEDNTVFEQANSFYSKDFDVQNIKPKWGGTLPDEMFINASLTRLNIDAKVDFEVMFFGNLVDKRTLEELQNDFFAFTLYGGMKTVRGIYVDFYDRICNKMCRQLGIQHKFKAKDILIGKHVNR